MVYRLIHDCENESKDETTRCKRCNAEIPSDVAGHCYIMIENKRYEVCQKCACFHVGIPYKPIFSKKE